ncbi:MAG: M43 family zinc metalloprotease [Bacteroidia bacterium]
MFRLILILLMVICLLPAAAQNIFQPSGKVTLHGKGADTGPKGYSLPAPVPATRNCQAVEIWEEKHLKFADLESAAEFEKAIAAQIQLQQNSANKDGQVHIIPVVVHVVHNGEAKGTGANISFDQIKSQIEILNEDFRRKEHTPGFNGHSSGADTEIEFELALRDPEGQVLTEPGVNRVNGNHSSWNSVSQIEQLLKPATQWDPEQYLNIWSVNYGGALKNNLGYGQFPSVSNLPGLPQIAGLASTDGIVIRYTAFGSEGNVAAPYNQGRTLTHELGHWLGLRHVWGDGDCNSDDYCDDTPVSSEPNYICYSRFNTCANDSGYDMAENYMNYTPDSCMNVFTLDQRARMRAVLAICPRRKELTNSEVYLPISRPTAFFEMNRNSICEGESVKFTDRSTNQPDTWEWTFFNEFGQTVATSTFPDPQIMIPDYGIYSVMLIAGNSFGRDTIYRENNITVLKAGQMTLPFYENFEEQDVLPGWLPYNPDNDRTWQFDGTASADTAGNWSIYFDNYDFISDPYGNVDVLISNRLNLPPDSTAWLTFQVAYARFSEDYSDTLALYYSLDCGQTFLPFWRKGGSDLATTTDETQAFRPQQNEWRKEQVSLGFLKGQPSVYLAIANWSGWGNNLYLDDISIKSEIGALKPVASFLLKKDTACANEAILFSDRSGNFPSEWHWEFPGGIPATSSLQQPVVRYQAPGRYAMKLVVKNAAGADSILLQDAITIAEPPALTISASDSSLCQGDSLTIQATGGYDHYWLDGRGSIIFFGQKIRLQPTVDQTYSVFAENLYGCPASRSVDITIKTRPPQPEITRLDDLLVSTPASSYQWWKNGQLLSGETGQTLQLVSSGSYQVAVVNVQGCTSFSEPVTAFPTGIEEQPDLEWFIAGNTLNIWLKNWQTSRANVEIYHASGKLIRKQEISHSAATFTLPERASGLYLIRVYSDDQWLVKKFLLGQ